MSCFNSLNGQYDRTPLPPIDQLPIRLETLHLTELWLTDYFGTSSLKKLQKTFSNDSQDNPGKSHGLKVSLNNKIIWRHDLTP